MKRSTLLIVPAVAATAVGLAIAAPATAYTPSVKTTARTIGVTNDDSIFLTPNGKVFGTGGNTDGEITGDPRTMPAPLTGLPRGVKARAVSANGANTLVLGSNGKVYGAGQNTSAQLSGVGTSNVTSLKGLAGLPKGVKAKAISAGASFSVVLGSNGKVYGTGINQYGQLTGSDHFTHYKLTPLAWKSSSHAKVVAISAGTYATAVVTADGKVYGTGYTGYGELGQVPSGDVFNSLTRIAHLPKGVKFSRVAVGFNNVVFLGTNHVAYATGANQDGQFGNGTVDSDANPNSRAVKLPVKNVVAITTHDETIGLIGKGGHLLIAGSTNPIGGNGEPSATFINVPLGPGATRSKIVEAALGSFHSVARNALGIVLGIGQNAVGELTGDTSPITALTPLKGQKVIPYKRSTISGTARVGHVLTAHHGTFSVVPSHYAYQWKRNGVAINGATGSTYPLRSADHGKHITVTVRGTRPGFSSGSVTSKATGTVSF